MFLWLLVFLQFGLSALLVLSSDWWPPQWITLLVAAPGIALAVSAWKRMGMRRVRIHPTTTADTKLITSGPYAIVRHPMYTGLLWFTAVLMLSQFAWWRLISWLALMLVLRIKASHEEQSMSNRFAEYADYQKQVGQLLPYLNFGSKVSR